MSDVVERARRGDLAPDEVEAIARQLEHQHMFDQLREQLLVMRYAGNALQRGAIERYLEFDQDPWAAEWALDLLCRHWGLTRDYIDWVVRLGEGMEWDCEWNVPVVRPTALRIAGEYLAKNKSAQLLRLLLDVAQDENDQVSARSEAVISLLVAVGVPVGTLPYDLSPDDDRFKSAIRAGSDRLQSEQDEPRQPSSVQVPPKAPIASYALAAIPALPSRSDLVERAKGKLLSSQELEALRQELGSQQSFDRVNEQLLALLFDGDRSFQKAVERYLDFQADPRIARLALALLCSWDLIPDYTDQLIGFTNGLYWDRDNDGRPVVRPLAFAVVASHLRRRRSRRLLEHLVNLASNTTMAEDDRDAAASALLRALCVPPTQIPSRPASDNQTLSWALQKARDRLEAE